MVNHGMAAKLTATDLLLLRSLSRLFLYKKIHFFLVCKKFCNNVIIIYPGTSLYEHILWTHLEKNRTYACTFPVQRKEINFVKVRFTMRYSSRKLSNEEAITTVCNLWRQIACSFQVKSGNVLLSGKKIFEISPFFNTWPGDLGKKVHAYSLRFSSPALKPSAHFANPFFPPFSPNAKPGPRLAFGWRIRGEYSDHCSPPESHRRCE